YDSAHLVPLREEDFETVYAGFEQLADHGGGELGVGVHHHFAGGHVDDIGGHESAFQIVGGHFDLRHLRLEDFLHQRTGDFLALSDDGFAALGDGMRELHPEQAVGNLPEKFFVFNDDLIDVVKGLENF